MLQIYRLEFVYRLCWLKRLQVQALLQDLEVKKSKSLRSKPTHFQCLVLSAFIVAG